MKSILLAVLFVVSVVCSGENITRSDLSYSQAKLYDRILTEYVTDTDGITLKEALADEHTYAEYLSRFARWYCTRDKEKEYILSKIAKREATFFSRQDEREHIDDSRTSVIGDTAASFEVTAYISSSCPHCKTVLIPLAHSIEEGPLAGRVNLRMKPIHPRIGDYALLAAADMGKMTDLFAAYDRIDQRLDDEMVLRAAEYARIDQGKLVNLLEKNKDVYNAQVRRNNEEADSVGVDYTPALFINGVKYRSNKRLVWIEDYIDWCEYRRSEELVQE